MADPQPYTSLAWQQVLHLLHVEKLLQALEDVLDPRQGEYGHAASVRHLTDRANRALRAEQ